MQKSVVITDTEALSPFGNTINETFNSWMLEKNILKEKFNVISNFDFYSYSYKVKTRIDRCGQLCIRTTAQLVKEKSLCDKDRIGLITVSTYGCSESRNNYFSQLKTLENTQYASPKDFVQSICNIPNSLATIECGIRGLTNHYVGASDASLTALWQAAKCVKDNIADEIIISSFETITEAQKGFLVENQLEEVKFSEVAASVKVQLGENIDKKLVLFEVLGIGFGVGPKTEEAVEIAINNAMKDSKISEQDVSFIVSNSNSISEFNKNEKRGIEHLFSNSVPTFMMKAYIGECFAPFSFLAMAILSKMAGYYLPNNLFLEADAGNASYLYYDNVLIKKGSILLLIGYNEMGSAAAVCLKYGQ